MLHDDVTHVLDLEDQQEPLGLWQAPADDEPGMGNIHLTARQMSEEERVGLAQLRQNSARCWHYHTHPLPGIPLNEGAVVVPS